jgi:hypothetical protein
MDYSKELQDRGQFLDLGLLTLLDSHPVNGYTTQSSLSSSSSHLSSLIEANEIAITTAVTENTQRLIHELFSNCPIEILDEGVGPVAVLPKQITRLPRQQHVPRPKPLTRWQKFALAKGISKKNKESKVFDESTGEFVPRWGPKSLKKTHMDKEWLIEAKKTDDPTKDLFEERDLKKKKKVLQNKISQASNATRAAYEEEAKYGNSGSVLHASVPPSVEHLAAEKKAGESKKKRRREADEIALERASGKSSSAVLAIKAMKKAKILEDEGRANDRVLGGRVPSFVPAGIPIALTMSEGRADGLIDNGKQPRPAPRLAQKRDWTEKRDERLSVAQISTMSLGKFDLPVDDEPKSALAKKLNKKKEKRLPNEIPVIEESKRNEKILKRMFHGDGDGEMTKEETMRIRGDGDIGDSSLNFVKSSLGDGGFAKRKHKKAKFEGGKKGSSNSNSRGRGGKGKKGSR